MPAPVLRKTAGHVVGIVVLRALVTSPLRALQSGPGRRYLVVMTESFESALQARTDEMLDACTRCGKCVEVCPATGPAGLGTQARENPASVIGGIIDILRHGEGNEAARQWAKGCLLSGDCIKACDYGVNPRFLLGMARVAMAQAKNDAAAQRRGGVESFRTVARDVTHLARLQLDDVLLARLGQGAKRSPPPGSAATDGELPDFVFYTGCNVLKTPHIALLALDIMDALGASYQVMGGPTHCCGVLQIRTGDVATSGRMGENSIDKLAQSKSKQVVSWCPSCQVQLGETTLPTLERMRGAKPFEMTPFHAVSAQQPRPAAAAAARARAAAHCAASSSGRPRRGRSRRGDPARCSGHRDRRSAAAGGRPAEQ
jgi:heterodisulfide reductase subunit D